MIVPLQRTPGPRPRSRALLLAAALIHLTVPSGCNGGVGGTDGTTTTGLPDVPGDCGAYVVCYGEATPNNKDEIEAKYGEGGSCWDGDEAEQKQCTDECLSGLIQYNMFFPDVDSCALPETDVELEIGAAVLDNADIQISGVTFGSVEQGGTLEFMAGGQGLWMIPVALRGRNFEVVEDPFEWNHPQMPKADWYVDVPGYEIIDGHMIRFNNYPTHFVDAGDGVLEHLTPTTLIIPDHEFEDVAAELDGAPAHLWVRLSTFENPPVIRELDVTLKYVELPGANPDGSDSQGSASGP